MKPEHRALQIEVAKQVLPRIIHRFIDTPTDAAIQRDVEIAMRYGLAFALAAWCEEISDQAAEAEEKHAAA